jgi:hypothetical protein
VISVHRIVRVVGEHTSRGRDELVDHVRVAPCPVRGDLDRRWAACQRAGEERPCRRAVAARGDQDVDDLAMLVKSRDTGRSSGRRP